MHVHIHACIHIYIHTYAGFTAVILFFFFVGGGGNFVGFRNPKEDAYPSVA